MKKITCGKDYEESGAIDIYNFPSAFRYLTDLTNFWAVSKCKRELFESLWGKQDFCWVGGSENRRFHVWVRSIPNCQLIILSHPVEGTCYDIVGENATYPWLDGSVELVVIAFLRSLFDTVGREKPEKIT